MKKLVIIISCLLLLASVGAAALSCGNNDDDTTPIAKTTWRLAAISLPDTLQTNLLQEFADKVEERSEGRLEIKVFAGGSLFQLNEIFDAVSSGAADLGYVGVTSYITKAPKTASASVFTSTIYENLNQLTAIDKAMVAEMPSLVAEAEANNIRHLFFGPLGSVDSFFKFPVNTMADLQGKTLAASTGVVPIVQGLKATPRPMDLSEFYLSAQTGVVDGWVMCPLENYVTMKFYEVAPYLVNFQFNSIMSVLMNQDSFDKLPADVQTIVETTALEIESKWNTKVAESDAQYIATAKAIPGVTVKVLEGAERKAWFDAVIVPVFTGMLNKYMPDQADRDQLLAIIDRVKTTGK